MNLIERGIWAGTLATGPMTLFMFEFFRRLPSDQKRPLPPAALTDDLLKPLGTHHLSSNRRQDLSFVSHFGYAASTGVLYSWISSKSSASPLKKGALFGLGVWAVSYLGWIPAFNLRPSAPKLSTRRNLMMIAAHLIWGTTLAFADSRLKEEGRRMLDGAQPTESQSKYKLLPASLRA